MADDLYGAGCSGDDTPARLPKTKARIEARTRAKEASKFPGAVAVVGLLGTFAVVGHFAAKKRGG